jgi:hypothetical protein
MQGSLSAKKDFFYSTETFVHRRVSGTVPRIPIRRGVLAESIPLSFTWMRREFYGIAGEGLTELPPFWCSNLPGSRQNRQCKVSYVCRLLFAADTFCMCLLPIFGVSNSMKLLLRACGRVSSLWHTNLELINTTKNRHNSHANLFYYCSNMANLDHCYSGHAA